jgi:uncharacterized protein (TIGR02246 family)
MTCMKALRWSALLLFIALSARADDADLQIEAAMDVQVAAWNRGDIATFVTTYSTDCIFVGKEVAHGRDQLLARYRKAYPTREAMGRLTFGNLQVHRLTADVALVTGDWHLERSGISGNIGGIFSLVFHHQADGWKIALDHTS